MGKKHLLQNSQKKTYSCKNSPFFAKFSTEPYRHNITPKVPLGNINHIRLNSFSVSFYDYRGMPLQVARRTEKQVNND